MVDSALQRARARALGEKSKAPAALQDKAPTTSVRTVKLQTGEVVPEQFYDLAPEDQQRMLELIREQDTKEKDDNAALKAASQLLDLRDKDTSRIKTLEGQLSTLLGIVEALQRRLDQQDNQLELAKSEALSEQQVELAQMVTNLSAIRAEAGAEMAEFNRQRDVAAAESRAALEAQATAIDALKGSVTSSTTLMAERSNAVIDQLATAEGRQSRLGVQLTELEGQADAIGNPITRPEVQALVTDAVTAEWKAQQPALVDAAVDEVRDQFPAGLGGQRVDSARTRQLREDANAFNDKARGGIG